MSTELARRSATVPIPKGVSFTVRGRELVAKGPLGTSVRPFPGDVLDLAVQGTTATLTLRLAPARKESQALLGTWVAHVRNLARGLTVGVEAKMKVVAA
ncbi:50S ribosomal protein L6P, partial [mine drainage metagenome]